MKWFFYSDTNLMMILWWFNHQTDASSDKKAWSVLHVHRYSCQSWTTIPISQDTSSRVWIACQVAMTITLYTLPSSKLSTMVHWRTIEEWDNLNFDPSASLKSKEFWSFQVTYIWFNNNNGNWEPSPSPSHYLIPGFTKENVQLKPWIKLENLNCDQSDVSTYWLNMCFKPSIFLVISGVSDFIENLWV